MFTHLSRASSSTLLFIPVLGGNAVYVLYMLLQGVCSVNLTLHTGYGFHKSTAPWRSHSAPEGYMHVYGCAGERDRQSGRVSSISCYEKLYF